MGPSRLANQSGNVDGRLFLVDEPTVFRQRGYQDIVGISTACRWDRFLAGFLGLLRSMAFAGIEANQHRRVTWLPRPRRREGRPQARKDRHACMVKVAPEGNVDVDITVEGRVKGLDLLRVRQGIQTVERSGAGRSSHPSSRSHEAARVDQGGAGIRRDRSMTLRHRVATTAPSWARTRPARPI